MAALRSCPRPPRSMARSIQTRRASRQIGEKLIDRMHWWRSTARQRRQAEQPPPGTRMAASPPSSRSRSAPPPRAAPPTSPGVYKYAEPITERGFVFMDSPGYDPCRRPARWRGAATSSASPPAVAPPSASAGALDQARDQHRDVPTVGGGQDVDRGGPEGECPFEEMGPRIFDLVLEVASGQRSKAEELGFGNNEFTPWVIGATM